MDFKDIPKLVINLESREDRRENIKEVLKDYDYEIVDAVKTSLGCNLSHQKCIKIAKERKYPQVCIIEDDFIKSSKMLNRPYSISGKIMHGEKRGSQIGFPTANINLRPNILLNGVYAVTTYINNKKHYGVANIGYKPTFNGEKYIFEANIFNFSDNLYGQRLEFDVISKIRSTKKFSGIEELKKNIEHDINMAKKIFKIK